eukprot:UN11399
MENCHIITDIARRETEHSTNHKKRARQGRENPYFKINADKAEFRIYSVFPQSKQNLVFRGTLGRMVIYKNSPWWAYVCVLLQILMLHKHKHKSLHYRFVSQAIMTQKEFYRKLPDKVMQEMRCGAGQEFKMAITLGEYCELICPVREFVNGDMVVCDAWAANQKLIENDAFNDDF